MFCAQIVGKPLTKPEPTAAPAAAAAVVRTRRRVTREVERAFSFMDSSVFGQARNRLFRGVAPMLAASAASLGCDQSFAFPAARVKPAPLRRFRSGRNHLLLDPYTSSQGAFVLKRHRRRVLERYPSRVKQGNFVGRAPALFLASDDLAYFAGNVLLMNEALCEGNVDFTVRPTLTD